MTTIVAVSRQFGSGGARIGRALAQRLGFQYADREILAAAARTLNCEATEARADGGTDRERVGAHWNARSR